MSEPTTGGVAAPAILGAILAIGLFAAAAHAEEPRDGAGFLKGGSPLELGSLVVHGRFKGSVHAKDRVEVSKTGTVEGEIHAPRLVVAEGARITGRVSTGERE